MDASNQDLEESVWKEYLIYFNKYSKDPISIISDEVSGELEQNVHLESIEKE